MTSVRAATTRTANAFGPALEVTETEMVSPTTRGIPPPPRTAGTVSGPDRSGVTRREATEAHKVRRAG